MHTYIQMVLINNPFHIAVYIYVCIYNIYSLIFDSGSFSILYMTDIFTCRLLAMYKDLFKMYFSTVSSITKQNRMYLRKGRKSNKKWSVIHDHGKKYCCVHLQYMQEWKWAICCRKLVQNVFSPLKKKLKCFKYLPLPIYMLGDYR